MEANYKQEIISSRVGGLGSSDAAMVLQVGKAGDINASSAQMRIAVMQGIIEKPDFPKTRAMQLGDDIEMKLYDDYKNIFHSAVSNPLYVSKSMSEKLGFNILNHIDIEVLVEDEEGNKTLVWFECKASKLDTADVLHSYSPQLAWHWMLLREKANEIGADAQLFLVHYPTNGMFNADSYALQNSQQVEIEESEVKADVDILKEGLKVIGNALPTFEYKQPEEIAAYNLPTEMQEAFIILKKKIELQKQMEKEIADFKESMSENMEKLYNERGIKSIKCEAFSVTYVAPSESVGFDQAKLKKEQPGIFAQYNTKVTKRKGYVTIK